MIVMLALLNDGAILSIAYDNVHYKDQPESWNMRMVLGISTVLGVIGVVSAFGLFYLGERVFHFDRAHIQTLMYLKLSVAGHLTIFLTRTRGPFWSIRPAKILWIAVLGTQIIATLIAVYGLFMMPLGWGWAGFVWGYALLWFLVNDRIKLLAYRIFDPVKAVARTGTEPEGKTKVQTETKAEPQQDAKVETKSSSKVNAKPGDKVPSPPEASSEAKPETKLEPETETKPELKPPPDTNHKTISDLTPQIAARAYELYERQGHRDGQSAQNWDKADQEIRATQTKAEPEAETKPLAKGGSEPEAKSQPAPDTNSKLAAKVEPVPAGKVEPTPDTKPDAKPEASPEPKPEAGIEPAPEVKAPDAPEAKAVPPSAVKSEPKPDLKADAKPTDKVEPKPVAKAETKPEPNAKPTAEVSPQLVKRVHEFYEQLGRENVRAVQELEEAEQKISEVETQK
jgi:H+-transporting ATPase